MDVRGTVEVLVYTTRDTEIVNFIGGWVFLYKLLATPCMYTSMNVKNEPFQEYE